MSNTFYAAAEFDSSKILKLANTAIEKTHLVRKAFAEKAEDMIATAVSEARQKRSRFSKRLLFPPTLSDAEVWRRIYRQGRGGGEFSGTHGDYDKTISLSERWGSHYLRALEEMRALAKVTTTIWVTAEAYAVLAKTAK